MVGLCVAAMAGIYAGTYGSVLSWVLGGITIAVVTAGLAVVGSVSGQMALVAVVLAIAGYNLGLVAGLVWLARHRDPIDLYDQGG